MRSKPVVLMLLSAFAASVAGCSSSGVTEDPGDIGTPDGAPPADSAPADAGPPDAPLPDAWVEPDCDLAALEEIASMPGAIRTTWLGVLDNRGDMCPTAGEGWTTETFLEEYCIYKWVGDFYGQRPPWEWLETDFGVVVPA